MTKEQILRKRLSDQKLQDNISSSTINNNIVSAR
jgi:hypothetical protein